MGKAKPKLVLDIEFEWVDKGGIFTRTEYARKRRIRCCQDMEKMSNDYSPFYFPDIHYPETNECEIDGY